MIRSSNWSRARPRLLISIRVPPTAATIWTDRFAGCQAGVRLWLSSRNLPLKRSMYAPRNRLLWGDTEPNLHAVRVGPSLQRGRALDLGKPMDLRFQAPARRGAGVAFRGSTGRRKEVGDQAARPVATSHLAGSIHPPFHFSAHVRSRNCRGREGGRDKTRWLATSVDAKWWRETERPNGPSEERLYWQASPHRRLTAEHGAH